MKLKKFLLVLFATMLSTACFSQNTNSGLNNLMRSNGRIYVVVAVVVTILTGLILYLVRLDRKISKLEKEQ